MRSHLSISVLLAGWSIFIAYILYDYSEHGIDVFKHFLSIDEPLETLFHIIILSTPIGSSITAYLMHERKILLEKTQQSEERYRSFVQNFQGIAFRGNMDFTPIFFHGLVEKITGYTEEELINGKPRWDQIIHPDDLSRLKSGFESMRTESDYLSEREYRIIHKNGTIRWVFESIKNINDNSGKPMYVQGVIHDITGRKKMESEIKKRINELEKFYKLSIGRELKMKELKDKLKEITSEKNN